MPLDIFKIKGFEGLNNKGKEEVYKDHGKSGNHYSRVKSRV